MKSVLSVLLATSLAWSSSLSNWASVKTLVPGTRISVGVARPDEVQQYFVSATDDTLTVLDLTNRDLPRAARKAVLAVAATQPGLFTAALWSEVIDGQVRVNQDGVFVKGRRLAAIEDILRTMHRVDVDRISRSTRSQRRSSRDIELPPPPVMYGGTILASGAVAACAERCGGFGGLLLVMGALMGPALAWTMLHDRNNKETEIVYRAP